MPVGDSVEGVRMRWRGRVSRPSFELSTVLAGAHESVKVMNSVGSLLSEPVEVGDVIQPGKLPMERGMPHMVAAAPQPPLPFFLVGCHRERIVVRAVLVAGKASGTQVTLLQARSRASSSDVAFWFHGDHVIVPAANFLELCCAERTAPSSARDAWLLAPRPSFLDSEKHEDVRRVDRRMHPGEPLDSSSA